MVIKMDYKIIKSFERNNQNKLMIVFSGAGYHDDKPLLYYAKKVARRFQYDILVVDYGKMIFQMERRHEYVQRINYEIRELKTLLLEYEKIISVEKSIGTLIAGTFYKENKIKTKRILLTPLDDSLNDVSSDDILIYGGNDPLFHEESRKKIDFIGCKSYYYKSANHSLEVENDVALSIQYLRDVVDLYIKELEG